MGQDEIRKIVGTPKMVVGTNEVTSLLRTGGLDKVFLASNVKDETREDLNRYAEMSGTEVEELEIPNSEVGVLCKKHYAVAVLGRKK